MSVKSWYAATALAAAASLSSCEKAKPVSDTANTANTAGAAAGLPAPDTIGATPALVADSVKMKQQASIKGTASKGAPATIPPKAAAKTSTKKIIGRDSVNTKPKLIGLPVVSDTAKRRPPR